MQSKGKLEKCNWSTEDVELRKRRDGLDSRKVGMRSGRQNWTSGDQRRYLET